MLKLGTLKFGVDGDMLGRMGHACVSACVDRCPADCPRVQGSKDLRLRSRGGGIVCSNVRRVFAIDDLLAGRTVVVTSALAGSTLVEEVAVDEPREATKVLVPVERYDSLEPSCD